ncbi:MAG: efflux RND transporter periplasmic adaptor subunit [Candidatus Caenarcaniphilales bacterium]|nr:efflux RND transporter periplasmic adaptor subunit [Candidatus Caenarcaniphilales bacterium]
MKYFQSVKFGGNLVNSVMTTSVTLILIPFFAGCSFFQPPAPQARPPAIVETVRVETEKVADIYRYQAQMDSRFYVELKPRVTGQISRILVESGQQVGKGTLLMVIDPLAKEESVQGQFQVAKSALFDLDNARATLQSLKAQLVAAESSLALAESELTRYKKLFAEQLISRTAFDQYQNNYDQARAQLDSTRAQIEAQNSRIHSLEALFGQSKSNSQSAQAELEYYRIRAPFEGRVGDLSVKLGDYVSSDTILTTISNIDRLEVESALPVEIANKLSLGDKVQIIGQDDEQIGEAEVFYIASTVNKETQTVLVKAFYPNPDHKIRANQQIEIQLKLNERPGLKIPTAAVGRLGESAYVYRVIRKEGKLFAKQNSVELGAIQNNRYLVKNGLEEGSSIIISGIEKVQDGAPVTLKKQK